jgi:choline kinase
MPADQIDAESVGLIFFRGQGPQEFRAAIEIALRNQAELKSWYLTIIDALAGKQMVNACSVSGHLWCEIDFGADLARAETVFANGPGGTPSQALPSTELLVHE